MSEIQFCEIHGNQYGGRFSDITECPTCVREERDRLREQLDDISNAIQSAMDERCTADEKHCTCVPLLRAEIKRLRELIPQAWAAGESWACDNGQQQNLTEWKETR